MQDLDLLLNGIWSIFMKNHNSVCGVTFWPDTNKELYIVPFLIHGKEGINPRKLENINSFTSEK